MRCSGPVAPGSCRMSTIRRASCRRSNTRLHEVVELNRQRVASDPRVQTYLQTWRSMLPNGVEIDVYREVE